ncbi:rhodanese-like domain-containing protein [Engelhardtia mirabilis]|uniref:rhodanese-like domain-containing protein n=1 Tax=Engelhardtia mirabilis TaxID=2528011 RepID=UPI0011A9EF12
MASTLALIVAGQVRGVRGVEPLPLGELVECVTPGAAFRAGWIGVAVGPHLSQRIELGSDTDAELDLDQGGELDRRRLLELRGILRAHVDTCDPVARWTGVEPDAVVDFDGTTLWLWSGDPSKSAAVWLVWRVLDEGLEWEAALAEARRIGLVEGSALEQLARDYVFGPEPERRSALEQQIRGRFPRAHQMSVAALAARLGSARRPPVLLDVREPDEYATSHLPGARRAATLERALAELEGLPQDTEVVTYCSVGWRSSDLAEALGAAGFTRVRNLEGSIFQWANRGHAVFRGGSTVPHVHPFDRDWGQLLGRDLWPESFR